MVSALRQFGGSGGSSGTLLESSREAAASGESASFSPSEGVKEAVFLGGRGSREIRQDLLSA